MEFKTLSINIDPRDDQDRAGELGEGIVSGYLAGFNVLDDVGDIILPGAFTKGIQENGPGGTRRIKHLWMHDRNAILGTYTELVEDDFGLRFQLKITPTTLGNDVLALYRAGDINEHSIGFVTIKYKMIPSWDPRFKKIRQLQEIRLFEGSAITLLAANPDTPTLNVKSADTVSRLAEIKKAIEAGDLSRDDILAQIDALTNGTGAGGDSEITTQEKALPTEPEAKAPTQIDLQPLASRIDELRKIVATLKC